jgi:hypothetical protein
MLFSPFALGDVVYGYNGTLLSALSISDGLSAG